MLFARVLQKAPHFIRSPPESSHPPCCSLRFVHTHTQGRDTIDNNLLRKTSRTDFKHEQKANCGWVRTSSYFDTLMVTKHDILGRLYSLLRAQIGPSLLRGESLSYSFLQSTYRQHLQTAPLPGRGSTTFCLQPAPSYMRGMERWAGSLHSHFIQGPARQKGLGVQRKDSWGNCQN